ncbi:MAG: hypothetical protein M1820_000512 [Bogoriella megaspora]|nr:MAG: hypothetical protein M1820_000512 [Bogoriella megaspora]
MSSLTSSTSPQPSTLTTPPPSTTSALSSTTTLTTFPFPPHHTFPPFFTLQPNTTTRRAQLHHWTTLILAYTKHHHIFRLSPIEAQDWDLFFNKPLRRRLALRDIREVIEFMCIPEGGGGRAEWIKGAGKGSGESAEAWIYWRRPEEWAAMMEAWVEATGQKGQVLTLYELVEGDAARGLEWGGMDMELLGKCLQVLVKKGKAGVFGQEGESGVKFF